MELTIKISYYLITLVYLLFVSVKGRSWISKSNWISGLVLSVVIFGLSLNITTDSMKSYYNSESYLNDRKLEVIENYKKNNVNHDDFKHDSFLPSDTYFEEVTISEKSGGVRVIFWADRDYINSGILPKLKWKIRSDFDFYLDKNNKLDMIILEYFEKSKFN